LDNGENVAKEADDPASGALDADPQKCWISVNLQFALTAILCFLLALAAALCFQ
jgi:hypothetical protein